MEKLGAQNVLHWFPISALNFVYLYHSVMDKSTEKILKQHSVRPTGSRKDILLQFVSREGALSQPDLEKSFHGVYDRVTIYRTLSLFLEKGILHKVPDDAGAARFALCPEACSEHGHAHEHVHFKCTECGLTTCFEDVPALRPRIPNGFKVSEMNVLIQGICRTCNEN